MHSEICSVVSDSLWLHGFSGPEYWSGLPCPPPGDLPNPGIKARSPALQADSLPSEPPGKPTHCKVESKPLECQGSLSSLFWRKRLWRLWSPYFDFTPNHPYTLGYWFKYKMESPQQVLPGAWVCPRSWWLHCFSIGHHCLEDCYFGISPASASGRGWVWTMVRGGNTRGRVSILILKEAKWCLACGWGCWTLSPKQNWAQRLGWGSGLGVRLFREAEVPVWGEDSHLQTHPSETWVDRHWRVT